MAFGIDDAGDVQGLLVDELNHRVKNMLTVVISLAAQTLKRAPTLQEFSSAFLGRINALTSSYTLLSRENWTSVSLHDIVIEETQPYISPDIANIKIDGPLVMLTPKGALALGMALHELATNALKYGALSEAGQVDIHWRIETAGETQQLVLHWQESGGPEVIPPEKRGLGIVLIERGIAHELSGTVEIAFAALGFRAILRAPVITAVMRHPARNMGILE